MDDAVVILGIFIICNRIQTMEEEDAEHRSIIQDKRIGLYSSLMIHEVNSIIE